MNIITTYLININKVIKILRSNGLKVDNYVYNTAIKTLYI